MRKKVICPIILALLTLSIGTTTNAEVNNIWTSTFSVNRPDGMWLEVFVTVDATGSVPNSIERIRIVAPDGNWADTREGAPIYYLPYHKGFDLFVDASGFPDGIPSGNYRITVWDNSGSLSVRERVNIRALPVPTNVYPGPGDTVSTTPTFSWDPVPGAKRYRLRIGKCWGNECSGYPPWIELYTNKTSIEIPRWILRPGERWLYRLDAYDDYDDYQNKSMTGYISFFTEP